MSWTTVYRRVAVKVGSNVLTRNDGTLDVTRLSALVDQISALRKSGVQVVLITSGAVACGRSRLRSASLSTLDDIDQRQLFSAVGQVELINRYSDLFGQYGVAVGQVLTLKESFATRRHYLNQRNCMLVMLENGVMPIVNENDTVSLTELMFTDNDELSGLVATMLDCDALIILSNIDGIYTGNPALPGSTLIRTVEPDRDLSSYIVTEKSGFGRGGMVTKHRIARKVASEGVEVIIANGKRENILTDLLRDTSTPSTRFVAAGERISTFKRWIAHSEGFVKGSITVNAKAAQVLLSDTASSLLAVGIVSARGDFEKDDLVDVVDTDGTVLAVGRTGYDVHQVNQMAGKRNQRPVIHYDYLYVK